MLSMNGNASVVQVFLANKANTHCLQVHEQVAALQTTVSTLSGCTSLKRRSLLSWCTFMGGLLTLPLALVSVLYPRVVVAVKSKTKLVLKMVKPPQSNCFHK